MRTARYVGAGVREASRRSQARCERARRAGHPGAAASKRRAGRRSRREDRAIAGVDEAGRGPLAGPVVAAAVILRPGPRHRRHRRLEDAERRRRARGLSAAIRRRALCFGIGWADPAEIDALNILHATFLAMRRAVLVHDPCPASSAGRRQPVAAPRRTWVRLTARAIIGGDATEPAISAASILAKTARDQYMDQMDDALSAYAFASHKGYANRRAPPASRGMARARCTGAASRRRCSRRRSMGRR